MSPSEFHKLNNLLAVILGGIETNNQQLAIQGVRRMKAALADCVCQTSSTRQSDDIAARPLAGATGKQRLT